MFLKKQVGILLNIKNSVVVKLAIKSQTFQ